MFSVGEALRRARLEQGLDLTTVSALTKIKEKHLQAIEADDRASLPSSFFYKNFVQQYARLLSLDNREINAEVERILSVEAPLPLPGQNHSSWRRVPAVTVAPRFSGSRTVASIALLVLVLGACSGIYAWYKHRAMPVLSAAASAPAHPPEAPHAIAAPAHPPPASPANETAPPVAAPAQEPVPARGVLLDVMAREETWLSVSSDGKPVFSGILAPHQSKTVEGKEYAKMRVGNAAGIEVRLNGRPLGPLGHRGQVLVVVFTPDNFQIVFPVKESD